MLRTIWALLLVLVTLPAAAQEFRSSELADAAANYRKELQEAVPAAKRQPQLIPRLRRDAEAEYRAKRYSQAADDLKKAITYGADDGLVWLRLAQALAGTNDDHVLGSAYNAYTKSTDPVERGNALFLIARNYDSHDKQKEALTVFQAGLSFTQAQQVSERVEQLKRLTAFRVTKVDLEAEADTPRACLRFNEVIAVKAGLHYSDYVKSTPELGGIVTARGDALCINGLRHGETYQIEILPGLPADSGNKTIEPYKATLVIPDRKSSVSFVGTGYVLPREGTNGLPVTTINLDKVKVRIIRVNDRNLVPTINADKLTLTFDSDSVDEMINQTGSLVWQGEMAITGERNRPVTTAIPLSQILRDKGNGVYLAVVNQPRKKKKAENADSSTSDADDEDAATPATNWILVSNMGMTTYRGSDGMAIAVRKLSDAKPFAGVKLQLYARNNGELTNVTTDADGLARIPKGLLQGKGGDEPFVIFASGPEGDFNFLEVGRAAFDLSDRGVTGRAQPGPVDGYLYTERGIYRPGEAVHLMALVRDDKADAVSNLPVTLRFSRPDGVVVEKRQLTSDKLGAHDETFQLARDARTGTWKAELFVDPKGAAIGSIEFRVEDFVPPTIKIALSAPDKPIHPNEAYEVEATASYYYGAPGAELTGEAHASIAFDAQPFPKDSDFSFGLVDEKYAGDRKDLDIGATDASGKTSTSLELTDLPDLTKPVAATFEISVFEPSGRAITDTLTRPIRQRDLYIGLRTPDDDVPDGGSAKVDIIAVDADGKHVPLQGLHWELLRENWEYAWFSQNGLWRHRTQIHDQPIEAGIIDVGTAPTSLSRKLPEGRYRWEMRDDTTGAQSSVRFHVGWWVEAELPDVPDKLTTTLDKPTYKPGETAKLFIKANFAGEAEITIAADKLLTLKSVALPAEGTTVDIPVDASWGTGVYALVSAYRPQNAAPPGPGGATSMAPRGPGRAVGVAALGIDPSARTLGIALSPPDVARPRAGLDIPVKVTGLSAGEEGYVTLAAVDEAVLKLTDYENPAPEKYYYGKRQLGVELRDLYGRLIDPKASGVGVLRSGGDAFAKRAVAGLPDKSNRVVALFSGIVKLDNDGAAKVHLDIPDFQGQLRLVAVAFAAHKVGSAASAVTVRDPIVTLVSLPRFLAPGDTAQLKIVVNNLEGAAGDYRIKLSATGSGTFSPPVDKPVKLATGESFNGTFPLLASTPGNIALHLDLTGPNNTQIGRDFTIGVRPAQSYQLKRFVARLEPGQRITLDDGAADEFLPGTGEAYLTVSPRPDWDVPGLLRSLHNYAYGCIEQTTSKALPLLYVESVSQLWKTDPGFNATDTVNGAIERIAGMQRSDGSFGVWSDSDDTVPWLDAYATDFLLRAKEHNQKVPDYVLTAALGWLRDYARQQHTEPQTLPATAYAHYVLARAKMSELPSLRYFTDTQLAKLPTQLSRAQLGAALAASGDMPRANAAYAAAMAPPPKRLPGLRYVDYGSDLRDTAGLLAFSSGDASAAPRMTAVMDRITELFASSRHTSTQEQAWLLMAAEAAVKVTGGAMNVSIDDAAPQNRSEPLYLRRKLGSGGAPQVVANKGNGPAWRTVSIMGVPKADLPAESSGYNVTRIVHKPDGAPADLSKVRQTDLLVVELKGTRTDTKAARALIVDLLPAGFEIQNAAAGAGGESPSNSSYSWLPKQTGTAYTEARDDRYVAAIDMPEGKNDFTLAYVVRAVTPGQFKYPALVAEDMYEPDNTGRTAMGTVSIAPR